MPLQVFSVEVPEGFHVRINVFPDEELRGPPAEQQLKHHITLPGYVSTKRPSEIQHNGKKMTVPACIATLFDRIRQRDAKLRARPETLRKLHEYMPGLSRLIQRDHERKIRGGMVPLLWSDIEVQ